ncbi:radical SAM protein [Pelagibaculum spongiae]|uniref:Radical SAM protein n=1 Tax=Pelagibaculum spongiae TaxID=2080658 RepID=A0A2V1H647_9GAMM|nr:radical SAM protein [Pelagibaculum spongiae]PVZ72225.1 radical SAM protein [Pelagibaculum spongiae]
MQAATGYETGDVRPPNESKSLMLRLTRGCSWNRCKFCSLYQQQPFSIRPIEEVIADIDQLHISVKQIEAVYLANDSSKVRQLLSQVATEQRAAFHNAWNWIRHGKSSVFLQDGNSIIVKPKDMLPILQHLTTTFPSIDRITTYARSKTLFRVKVDDLITLKEHGLNRIHIGMESGSDIVLESVNKGVTKAQQVTAGKKVKQAGIELSVYFMPGLGGTEFTRENAVEAADLFNQINPDYIRIRTLSVSDQTELFEALQSGVFTQLNDEQAVDELKLFLQSFKGISSKVRSDHILNLLQEIDGSADHKEQLLIPINNYQQLPEHKRFLYRVGRRIGVYQSLEDLESPELFPYVQSAIDHNQLDYDNIDQFTKMMMTKFI